MIQFVVKGLVKYADRVRRELSHPITSARLLELRTGVEAQVGALAQRLAREGMTARNMPAPTRRAYLFLAGLDWDAVNVDLQEHASGPPPGSVFFAGLERAVKNLTARLGSVDPSGRGELLQSLRETALRVERQCVNLRPHQIKPKARALRGWLRTSPRRRTSSGTFPLWRRHATPWARRPGGPARPSRTRRTFDSSP